jgi:integrase
VEGTYGQAQKALTKLLREADTQAYIQPSKVTLTEHCATWLRTKVSLGPKTLREYTARLAKDVYPVLGMKTLDSISGHHIQSWCSSLTLRGLSPRTVEFSHTVLSQALKYAVRTGMLSKNPCEFTELPRKIHTEQQVFSPEQASLFLSHSKTSKWNCLWTVMLTTGLRPQEALALKWSDVDTAAKTITAIRALVEVEAGKYEPMEMKTRNSRRLLSIPDYTVQTLLRHQFQQGVIGGFVFPNEAGGHYDLSPVRKGWKRDIILANASLAEENNAVRLPDINLYGARHSHLTHFLKLGGHPKAASSRAGHGSAAFTMDTYQHAIPEVDAEAGEKIGVLLFKGASNA